MGIELQWQEQMNEIENEENYFIFLRNHMTYPHGLINLVSNPIFDTFSISKKILAIRAILLATGKVLKNSIHYDYNNNILYYISLSRIHYTIFFNNYKIMVYK